MIEEGLNFLRSLEGSRMQGGPAQNTFNNLFEIENITTSLEVDTEDVEDPKYRALENRLAE